MSFTPSAPKAPPKPEPIKTPTRDEAKIASEEQDRLARRRGRASTILSRAQTRTAQAGQEAKTRLGM